MRRCLFQILLFCALAASGPQAHAAAAPVVESLEVVLEDWGPYLRSDRPDLRVMREQLSLLLQKASIAPRFRFQPFARTERDFQSPNGDVLLAFPMAARPEREPWLLLSDPLFDVHVVLVWHQANPQSLTQLSDPAGRHRIAVIRASSTAHWCEARLKNCVGAESGTAVMRQLAARRVDAALLSGESVWAQMREDPQAYAALQVAPTPVFGFTVHIALPRQHPESPRRLAQINAALATLVAEGRWSRDMTRLRSALFPPAD